jgi:hypothetical protein
MKRPIRVEYSRDGFRDLIATGRWWREHHPSNEDAFDVEYAAAIELLKQVPEAARTALMRRYKRRSREGVARDRPRRHRPVHEVVVRDLDPRCVCVEGDGAAPVTSSE